MAATKTKKTDAAEKRADIYRRSRFNLELHKLLAVLDHVRGRLDEFSQENWGGEIAVAWHDAEVYDKGDPMHETVIGMVRSADALVWCIDQFLGELNEARVPLQPGEAE